LDDHGIILGERLANQLNIGIGDKTVLFDLATLRGSKKRLKQFTVTGIFHSGMSEYDQSLVYTNLKQADGLFNMEGKVSGHVLRMNDPALANDFSQLLGEELAYPYMVMTWKEKNRALFKWMDVQRWPILFIFSLIALVGIVNIISALAMIVLDKTRQIGILKSLGLPQGKLKQVFLAKGFIIGVAGAVFGSALALFLAWLQNHYKLITVPEDVYFMDYIPVDVNLAHVGIVIIVSVIFSVIAAIWPTIRAGKIQPAKALNYE
jgi:lipoprotein-releasing system permease protein